MEGHKSQDLLQPVGRERATFEIPGHLTASAATRGATQSRVRYGIDVG